VHFDLPQALKWLADGWSYRKIGRMMGISRETVRTRILAYEARLRAQQPELQNPRNEEQHGTDRPGIDRESSNSGGAKPKAEPCPVGSSPQERGKESWSPEGPDGLEGIRAASAQGVVGCSHCPSGGHQSLDPETPDSREASDGRPDVIPEPVLVTPPEPDSNYDGLIQYWAIRGRKDFKPDARWFFLVNGQQNLAFATGLEQFAVSINRWHEEYRDLEAFRDAERIWVVIDRRDDNGEFVRSLVNDIWIRERCVISVGYVSFERWIQTVMRDRMHRMWDVSPRKWESYDSSQFEAAQHFVSLPQPNHVQRIEELLVPPPEPEKIIPDGGGYNTYGAPYPGCPPQADNVPPQRGDRSCGFAF
jgi:hypothetical protein